MSQDISPFSLDSILEAMTEVSIIASNLAGKVTYFNRGAEKLLGYQRGEVVGGGQLAHFFDPHEIAERAKELAASMGGPVSENGAIVEMALRNGLERREWTYVCRDGSRRIVEQSITRVRDSEGCDVGFVATAVDVSAYVRDRDELSRRASEMESLRNAADAACMAKSEFLANMSHEIRTPLTAILGYAELLREEGDVAIVPEKRLKTIDTITNAGQHLLTVINDILDLSKIEADKMTVEMVETVVPDILWEVESLMRTRATEKGLHLETRFRTPIPDRIIADPTRVRQILINLVGNAAKFTACGHILVEASVIEDTDVSVLRIDVEDSGPGMTAAQVGQLFEVFSQADTTVTRKHGGTGLGLTICRRLAHLMKGEVSVVWSAPGKGSCFRLELPICLAKGARNVEDFVSHAKSANRGKPVIACQLNGRILLVEDGPDNQRLISHILRKAGATVEIAEHGEMALKRIEQASREGLSYDLILTDMQMPVMDGYKLARTLRSAGSRLPIIALTALAMREDREKCLAAGCDDYAVKPIDKVALLSTCSLWMQNAQGPVCVLDRGKTVSLSTLDLPASPVAPNV